MKLRITDSKKAVEIMIEAGKKIDGIPFHLETYRERGIRNPEERIITDIGFERIYYDGGLNYHLDMEIDPKNPPKIARREVIARWREEGILVTVDETEETPEDSPKVEEEVKESPKEETTEETEETPLKKGVVYEGELKYTAGKAAVEGSVYWNGKFYGTHSDIIYLNVRIGSRPNQIEGKVVMDKAGLREDKMASRDERYYHANKKVFDALAKRVK